MKSKLSHGMEKTAGGERWSKRSLNDFSKAKGQVEKKKPIKRQKQQPTKEEEN